jgi:hypothetical protein
MPSRLRENSPAVIGAALGILIVGWLGLSDWAWTDYDREARPAFDALLGGHVLQFLRLAPAYGGSLVIRAPFVLVPKLWGGGELTTFRAAAAPCLIASGVFGVWLVSKMRKRGATKIATGVALMLCVANPITLLALDVGHPEELLGAVLCVAAVLAAMGNRPLWAGVILGLAVANKESAIVAVGPVLLALPEHRIRAILAAAAVAALVLLPLAAEGGFVTQAKSAAAPGGSIFSPYQFWWFLGPHLHVISAAEPWATRMDPAWLAKLAHPLIAGIALPLTLLCACLRRRRTPRPANEALLLLVFLLLLRCALDPWDNWYYPLPFLFALLAWETLTFRRPPLLALTAACAVWFMFHQAVPSHGFSTDAQFWIFLVFTLPTVLAIAGKLYAPRLSDRLLLLIGRGRVVPTPA